MRRTSSTTGDAAAAALVVPAYFHPDWARPDWEWLVAARPAAVILNPASGPGEAPDLRYRPWTDRLRQGGTAVLGYVPIRYGRRPMTLIERDVERYIAWYGLSGVFLDQSPSGHESAGPTSVRAACQTARAVLGECGLIVLNPGVSPAPGLFDIADLVVSAECSYAQYLERDLVGGPRTWHLVHSAPPGAAARRAAVERAKGHRVAGCYVTSLGMPNPWERLDPALIASDRRTQQ